ncbi:hypothetical protein FRC03_000590 [Tulasnella sp. 419]|nr:hypothetical protein FRC03_000590 [Tulasnella sp. 419]
MLFISLAVIGVVATAFIDTALGVRDNNRVPLGEISKNKLTRRDNVGGTNNVSKSLRDSARKEGKLANQFKKNAKVARRLQENASAKKLSHEAHKHETKKNQFNKQASELIYKKYNPWNRPDLINLHGLHTDEAIKYTEAAIKAARQSGKNEVKLIPGWGKHSKDGVAKINPAVQEWLKRNGYPSKLHHNNDGMIVVDLRNKKNA